MVLAHDGGQGVGGTCRDLVSDWAWYVLLERQRTREYGWGGAVVRPLGAFDSETLALGAFVIVVQHAAVRRLAEAWRTIAGE